MSHESAAIAASASEIEAPINEREAARILGLEPATLRRWRCQPPAGGSPPYRKYGTSHTAVVRYLVSELLVWRESRKRETPTVDGAE